MSDTGPGNPQPRQQQSFSSSTATHETCTSEGCKWVFTILKHGPCKHHRLRTKIWIQFRLQLSNTNWKPTRQHMRVHEGRSKFVVERKCVTKLVSPLSFYMVSCFYIFLPLPKHSFEASLLESSSLPIFVCMHWELLVVFVVSHGSSFALLGRSLQPATLLKDFSFWHVLATHSC